MGLRYLLPEVMRGMMIVVSKHRFPDLSAAEAVVCCWSHPCRRTTAWPWDQLSGCRVDVPGVQLGQLSQLRPLSSGRVPGCSWGSSPSSVHWAEAVCRGCCWGSSPSSVHWAEAVCRGCCWGSSPSSVRWARTVCWGCSWGSSPSSVRWARGRVLGVQLGQALPATSSE